jgi:hypothetical protein
MRRIGWWMGAALAAGPLVATASAPKTVVGAKEPPVVGKAPAAPALARSLSWHDGQGRREVWVNPRLLAEFPSEGVTSAVSRIEPRARPVPSRGGARIWEVDDSSQVLARIRREQPGSRVSPVLHDVPSPASAKRALPGNVIVQLDPAWNPAAVDGWIAKRGLRVVRKLPVTGNAYLVASEPGLPSLELANALASEGQVRAAYPDWWQETFTR